MVYHSAYHGYEELQALVNSPHLGQDVLWVKNELIVFAVVYLIKVNGTLILNLDRKTVVVNLIRFFWAETPKQK